MSRPDLTALTSNAGISHTPHVAHAPGLPPLLARLLAAPEGADRDAAWAEFLAAHTGLLLHTCQSLSRDRDAVMNGYAYILDALRDDNCRRLRGYTADPGTRFTTWLVVVARRLLLDHHRQRYGRPRSDAEGHRAEHAARRRLEDLVAAELDPDELRSPSERPDAALIQRERADALRAALAVLDPSDRLLLALRFEDERPMREIAATLGLPTVFHGYRRLAAVLATLQRALALRGIEPSES